MINTLDTSNAAAISYTTEELGITILGGIRLDTLDRMRVAIKIEIINRQSYIKTGND